MNTFFILSLPRSRTAWLANFLTYEDSFCFHEALSTAGSIRGLRRMFERTGKEIVGNSDCANILLLPRLMEEFPDAKYVIIDRYAGDVAESLESVGLPYDENVQMSKRLLDEAIQNLDCLIIDYDYLDEDACRELWNYCIGTEFDRKRWEMLDGMNITIDMEKMFDRIQSNREQINNLFGDTRWPGLQH